jgi:hypothetical protein
MNDLPAFGLANTVTGFATLFAGCMCLALSRFVQPQPGRWRFAYWTIVVTGVFTITLHGFGETVSGFGPRWFWAFLDTGSNIVVAWAFAIAVLGDYDPPETQRWARPFLTVAMIVGVTWHFADRLPGTERHYLIPLGDWGGFHPGETWLIALSFTVTGLLIARRSRIPASATPLLRLVVGIFLCGLLLATARNDEIVYPFFSIHALWHLVGAFGFVAFWAFNHVRFAAASPAMAPSSVPR